jgi:hypothetical protein
MKSTDPEAMARTVGEEDSSIPEIPEDDEKKFRVPGFQRMRIDWRGEDRPVIDRARSAAEAMLWQDFKDAYLLLRDLYDIVRNPIADENGEIVTDQYGQHIYERNEEGRFIENWHRLTDRHREHFMYSFTTRMVAWEQIAQDATGEALFAKAAWEEKFSLGYQDARQGTIEGRTAVGKLDARTERYFAIFKTYYARKADAFVRSLKAISFLMKDQMRS